MKVCAPWTKEQVAALDRWQRCDWVHPFTCGGERRDVAHLLYAEAAGHKDFGVLVATPDGWLCPTCNYRQNWAHEFMFHPPPKPGIALR
jgi:hypothetical protein